MGSLGPLLRKDWQVIKRSKKATGCQLICPWVFSILAALMVYLGFMGNKAIEKISYSEDESINLFMNKADFRYKSYFLYPDTISGATAKGMQAKAATLKAFNNSDTFVMNGTSPEDVMTKWSKIAEMKENVNKVSAAYLTVAQKQEALTYKMVLDFNQMVEAKDTDSPLLSSIILFQSAAMTIQWFSDMYWMEDLVNGGNPPAGTEIYETVTLWANAFPIAVNLRAFMALMGSIYWSMTWIPLVLIPGARLVVERRMKILPMMKTMGLSESVYTMSHVLNIMPFVFLTAMANCLTMLASGALDGGELPSVLGLAMVYGMCLISLTFLLSIVCVSAAWMYIVGMAVMYMIPYTLSYLALKWSGPVQWMVCLFAPNAYFYGLAGILSRSDELVKVDPWGCVLMLAIDTVLYLLLFAYLTEIKPGEFGVPKPWYFPFQGSYWKQKFSKAERTSESEGLLSAAPTNSNSNRNSTSGVIEQRNVSGAPGISIAGLMKQYDGANHLSVDGLTLDMYPGEIFALLGHNGAGKTTTISMLTGLTQATSYETAKVGGYDITTEMDSIHQVIGVCPQHDVLFDDLNAIEHLELFSGLRGLDKAETKSTVESLLALVELDSAQSVTKGYSGGQKRKLSLAIALVGKPKIIFLDEPSSGMDPYSRRRVWDILKRIKEGGTTVVLTTHFMEEADVLGDNIGIMSRGKLYCCGSSMYLKEKFGVGYYLRFDVPTDAEWPESLSSEIYEGLQERVPSVARLTDQIGCPSFLLPVDSVPTFPSIFDFLGEVQSKGKNSKYINSYSMAMNTLEDVFVNISQKEEEEELKKITSSGAGGTQYSTEDPEDQGHNSHKQSDRHAQALDDLPKDPPYMQAFTDQVKVNAYRRFLLIRRRPLEIAVFLMIAMIVGIPPFMSQKTNQNGLDADSTKPINMATSPWNAMLIDTSGNPDDVERLKKEMSARLPNMNWTTFKNITETAKSKSVLDMSPQPNLQAGIHIRNIDLSKKPPVLNATVYVNILPSYVYAGEIMQNTINVALARIYSNNSKADLESSVQLWGKPTNQDNALAKGKASSKKAAVTTDSGVLKMYFTIAMGLLVCNTLMGVGEEWFKKVYHIMRIHGMIEGAYWLANGLIDLLLMFITSVLVVVMGYASDMKALQGGAVPVFFLGALLTGLSVICLLYCVALLFCTSMKPPAVFFINLVAHVLCMVGPALVSVIQNDTVSRISQFLTPQSAFMHMIALFQEAWVSLADGDATLSTSEVFNFRESGTNDTVVQMLIVQIVWAIIGPIALYIVLGIRDKAIRRGRDQNPNLIEDEDSDVRAERETIREAAAKDGLTKEFPAMMVEAGKTYGIKKAVKNVSWAMRQGECFGLLGPNGAGKSTTINSMVGEIPLTFGQVTMNSVDVSSLKRREMYLHTRMGACLQTDALWDNFNAYEHMYILLRIRSCGLISDDQIQEMAREAVDAVGLGEHTTKKSKSFSGGMKRKLCVAMSMFTGGKIIVLDEPSSGMDPFSRRILWQIIHGNLTADRCVLLTTHSMEEADNVCSRLGIQVLGEMKCMGSSMHLKEKFGGGYSIEATLGEETTPEALCENLAGEIPQAKLAESYSRHCVIQLGKLQSLADIFRLVELNKEKWGVEAYSVQQASSLEQIFLRFAQVQMEVDGYSH